MPVILNNGTYFATREPSPYDIKADTLPAGTKIWAFHGWSTVYPDLDFETYSEAGYVYNPEASMFVQPPRAASGKVGLKLVGASVYARHPSTEVMSLAYNLKDGVGARLWYPGCGWLPVDLFALVMSGGLLEAHNAGFENEIWNNVCVPKYGFPPLATKQLRCSMAKAAAFALPSGLEKLSIAINASVKKDTEGANLMRKLSVPRKPTKANQALRYTRAANPNEFQRQDIYNINDTTAESEVSAMLPDLQPDELDLWLLDQEINLRGVHIDKESLEGCISIVEQAFARYQTELQNICGGYYDEKGKWVWNVSTPSEVANMRVFLAAKGVQTSSLDAEQVTALLKRDDLPPDCRRVLEIRDMLGASSVKKLFAMLHQLCPDNRVRGLFAFCGADRTGRFAGRGAQPQNMPSGGPTLNQCDKINGCGHYFHNKLANCPWCHADAAFSESGKEWNPDAVDQALKVIREKNLDWVEHYYGDAIAVVSGCLRGLFTAAPGKDLVSSDFSAIEAVVLAELAGEQWRIDVFKTHGKIYEMSAAKISGVPFEEIIDYKKRTGEHHPLRKKLGKVAELACFGAETQVLTKSGYKRIVEISSDDWLWDGMEWVKSDGVIEKETQHTFNLNGPQITLSHAVAIDESHWVTAHDLFYDQGYHGAAIQFAEKHLPEGWSAETPKTVLVSPGCVEKTYDILNCGPRNRFTIWTASGHLIVHNSGYAGWIGAWKNFGADKFMNDDEIVDAIKAWRNASPMVVELWGGQWRKHPKKWEFTPEFYGLEGAAVQAIMNPGTAYAYRYLSYVVQADVLYCRLPSGRLLSYHTPRLYQETDKRGLSVWKITFMGQNAVTGLWERQETYSGKLTENCCQAVARDILTYAMRNLERSGYPIVLHIHDEIVSEVDKDFGSIEEFEKIMSTMPPWAADWPIRASGGWRGLRYRKG